MDNFGDQYQQKTKYFPDKMSGHFLDWSRKPKTFKTYPGKTRITLPAPNLGDGAGLWETIQKRRSEREFRQVALSQQQVSQLLWACQGITATDGDYLFRAAPSAGALYPVETYTVINSVQDLESGIYHYAVREHALEQLQTGNFGAQFARAALNQDMVRQAAVVFIWTAIFQRSKWKYGDRAYRYIYLDAGHIAAQLSLAAVALGLGSCQIAALFDDEINALINVDGAKESVVYMSVVGKI